MKFPMYAIRDIHTGFLSPTVEQNDNVAMRNFAHACMQSSSLFNSHPEHYSLYRIGEYDSETGSMTSCVPVHIYDATEVF